MYTRIIQKKMYNFPKLEKKALMTFSRKMSKQIVLHSHNEILLSNKKEQITVPWSNMNELQKQYAK